MGSCSVPPPPTYRSQEQVLETLCFMLGWCPDAYIGCFQYCATLPVCTSLFSSVPCIFVTSIFQLLGLAFLLPPIPTRFLPLCPLLALFPPPLTLNIAPSFSPFLRCFPSNITLDEKSSIRGFWPPPTAPSFFSCSPKEGWRDESCASFSILSLSISYLLRLSRWSILRMGVGCLTWRPLAGISEVWWGKYPNQ